MSTGRSVKINFKEKKKTECIAGAFNDSKRPIKRNNAIVGHFYYRPVLTFNVDSLSKPEQREIIKIFWSEYDN